MKPDWKDAPEWANYLAMDADGYWYWYENLPWKCADLAWRTVGQCQRVSQDANLWKDSLEKRPGDSTSSGDV